jgi:hypothetical protein
VKVKFKSIFEKKKYRVLSEKSTEAGYQIQIQNTNTIT